VPGAIDLVRDKLERQLRDHHGKKRPLHRKSAIGYAETEARSEP
jgi:ribosome-associated translation inhibitor RaiA